MAVRTLESEFANTALCDSPTTNASHRSRTRGQGGHSLKRGRRGGGEEEREREQAPTSKRPVAAQLLAAEDQQRPSQPKRRPQRTTPASPENRGR